MNPRICWCPGCPPVRRTGSFPHDVADPQQVFGSNHVVINDHMIRAFEFEHIFGLLCSLFRIVCISSCAVYSLLVTHCGEKVFKNGAAAGGNATTFSPFGRKHHHKSQWETRMKMLFNNTTMTAAFPKLEFYYSEG
jgi:hypothetical protein